MRIRLGKTSSLVGPTFLVLCSLGFGLVAAQELKPASPLIPEAISLPASVDAQYFVQADSKGNLVLLRSDTLEVFPLLERTLGKGKRLQLAIPTAGQFSDVAGNGRSWVLVESNQVLYFKDGMLQDTPDIGWLVTSVALAGEAPVAGVLPMSVGQSNSAGRPKSPPLLVQLGTSGWETKVAGSFPRKASGQNMFNALFAERTVRLASSRKGIWVAYPFSGRVVHYTPSGRADLVMVLGKGSPIYREDEAELRKGVLRNLEEKGYKNSRAMVGAFTARLLIRGMAERPNGDLYMLLDHFLDGEVALVRYNSDAHLVEAAPVHFPGDAEVSIAAGREGLAWTTRGGSELWELNWATLEAASWKEVKDARLVSGGPEADTVGSR